MASKVVETQSYLDDWIRVEDHQQKIMQSNLDEFLDVNIEESTCTTASESH
jgi:hypothetical protein